METQNFLTIKYRYKRIFLVNPKDKQGLCLDMVWNEAKIEYNKLKDFTEIKNV